MITISSMFATVNGFVDDEKDYDATVKEVIRSHLQIIVDEFNRYFLEYNETESKGIQKLF